VNEITGSSNLNPFTIKACAITTTTSSHTFFQDAQYTLLLQSVEIGTNFKADIGLGLKIIAGKCENKTRSKKHHCEGLLQF
jgi:hypothetical protein